MEYQQYLNEKQELQKSIINFIDNESNVEENYNILLEIIGKHQINETAEKFEEFLYLLSDISNNYNRTAFLISKIEKIIKNYKDEIKQTFSNSRIYKIFKRNQRILLFLIDEKIIIVDDSIASMIRSQENSQFFNPENKSFNCDEIGLQIENLDEFNKKRKIGENDNYICGLIRDDSIDEFISFCNQKNLFLSMKIEPSIFETNQFLLKKEPTLLEYSAFFGSVQIFKYLFLNKAQYSSSSLWLYSVHGNNPELFSFLIENNLKPDNNSYKECFFESIKCHHIDVANYLRDNFLDENELNNCENDLIKISFKYHNYMFFPNDLTNKNILFYSCKYNYATIVKILLKTQKINVNLKLIQKTYFNKITSKFVIYSFKTIYLIQLHYIYLIKFHKYLMKLNKFNFAIMFQ